jgi:hypothetical protein
MALMNIVKYVCESIKFRLKYWAIPLAVLITVWTKIGAQIVLVYTNNPAKPRPKNVA